MTPGHRVHLLAGFTPAGRRVRAWCSCGEVTTPRVNQDRALQALQVEHGTSTPTCERCGHEHRHPLPDRNEHLQVLVNGRAVPNLLDVVVTASRYDEAWLAWREAEQTLACADLDACQARTVSHEWPEAPVRAVQPPTLRLIPGRRADGPRRRRPAVARPKSR